MKYTHTEDMGEISGFGGAYEQQCQIMLDAGVQYLSRKRDDNTLKFLSNENVMGIIIPDNNYAEGLYNAVLHSVSRNCTGAMMQAVIERLQFINSNGWEAYCKELREHPPEEEHDPIDDPDFEDEEAD